MTEVKAKVTRASLTLTECPVELANKLQFMRLDIQHDKGNFVTNPVPVAYASYDEKTKTCRTFPNALHLVQKHAAANDCSLVIQEQRVRPILDLASLDSSKYRSICLDALKAVAAAQSSGIIVGPTGIGKTSILCGLVKLVPKTFKILVTTEDRNVTLQLHKALSEALPDEEIGIHCKPTSKRGRIIVTNLDALKDFTQGEMAYSQCALKDFDVWICDEVHRLPVPSRIPFLSQFRTIYSWGLTATHTRADNSQTLNEVAFGPVIYSVNHAEVFERQAQTGEKGIVPVKVMVFPLLTAKPIPESEPLFSKVRHAYMQNPLLKKLIFGCLGAIPDLEEAKIMIFVDTRRLGFLLSKAIPGFTFIHGQHSLSQRQEVLEKFKSGELTKVICTDIWSEGIDVPDLKYVIDCSYKVSPNRIIQRAGRAARSAGDKTEGMYVMLLSFTSQHLFNQGIKKLQAINSLGWEVRFMFDREAARNLPFEQAALLGELGKFI